MFLLAVSSFWFGCNNAAKEIVKERIIYTRERDFNLRIGSYYASKLLLLTAFSWLQTILLFTIVWSWCRPPGPATDVLMVMAALALAGSSRGIVGAGNLRFCSDGGDGDHLDPDGSHPADNSIGDNRAAGRLEQADGAARCLDILGQARAWTVACQ